MVKVRLHSYTYGCFLVSGAKAVAFLSIKKKRPYHAFFICVKNFIWKKGRGNFWRPQFALWRPKIYTWLPVGARIKKLISDPEKLPSFFILSHTWQFRHCVLIQPVCRRHVIHEPNIYGTACHESFVAQWLEHPTGVQKVTVSIPVGDSDFSLYVLRSWHVDHVISHFFTKLKIYHLSLFK